MKLTKSLFKGCLMLLGMVATTGILQATSPYKTKTAESEGTKKPLDHSVYDKWVSIGGYALTKDGKYTAIYNNRTENDGFLQVINLEKNSSINIHRGARVKFAPDSKHMVCFISPYYAKKKEAKIKKFKGDKIPKDSLCILNVANGAQMKFPMAKKYELPKEGGHFLAFEARIENDSLKRDGIFIYDLEKEQIVDTLKNLESFFFNKQGTELYCVKKVDKKEKGSTGGIVLYHPATQESKTILEGGAKCSFSRPFLSKDESMLFFYANTDTTQKFDNHVEIWTYKFGQAGWASHPENATKVISNNIKGLQEGYRISKNRGLTISQDGKRLFFGVSKIMPQKDTSKYQEEKAQLDVWHYNDPYIQTRQKQSIGAELKKSYLAYISLDEKGSMVPMSTENGETEMIQLAAPDYPIVRVANDWSSDWAYAWSGER